MARIVALSGREGRVVEVNGGGIGSCDEGVGAVVVVVVDDGGGV